MDADLPPVPALDHEAVLTAADVRELLPVGAFGVWASVIDLLAGARGSVEAPLRPRPRLTVFAADHDIAELSVSATPPGETRRRAADLATGVGVAAGLAAASGTCVSVVDVGLREPVPEVPDRIAGARPAGRIDLVDAMNAAGLAAAVQAGRDRADAAVDAGSDLLIGATCGVGVSTPVAALTAALTGMEPVDATSRGSGIDDNAWIRKAAAVRDGLFRVRRAGGNSLDMLRVGGGPDLAALTGFVAQAATRRTPVIVHDLPSTVAAVLAHRLAPGADTYFIVSSLAPERGHPRLLGLLGRDPLTDWSMTGHSGIGALMLLPSLLAAVGAFDGIDRTVRPNRSPHAISTWDATLL
ncbi:nicotinate-nucleotide--dimethylbenzimidazole phosphoribosyltransferase [Nakamurella sp.]|uniref:nicotinate-nucleotide--dimethylbenzimidazole phosphoribosyltransferase n=1 Tax=Nakamurella sp. TaxID=1869182 RepID=UPI00378377E8